MRGVYVNGNFLQNVIILIARLVSEKEGMGLDTVLTNDPQGGSLKDIESNGGNYTGVHLFPFRTEKLSPVVPMVLQSNVGE